MYRIPKRVALTAAFTVVVIAATIATSISAAGQAPSSQGATFLGFDVGEERRYVLGPPEALGNGESGNWLIRLAEVTLTEDEPLGLFVLEHNWHIPGLGRPIPQRTVINVESSGSILANAFGFPLRIDVKTKRQLAGVGEETYSLIFEYEDGEYRKTVTSPREDYAEDVGIRENAHVDFNVPSGIFAYLPGPPGCFLGQPRSKPADNSDCEESLFANPALLGLAIPSLWEANGEREFVFFTPLGPIGDRSTKIRAGSATPVGSGRSVRPGDSGRLMYEPITPFSYHEIETLRYGDRTSIRLGRRAQTAWVIEGPSHLFAIYVDDEGRVVRVDLPKRDDADPGRWIRMLRPSEF